MAMNWAEGVVRFEDKYMPEPNTGCWLWFGATIPDGYGSLRWGEAGVTAAHRVAWEIHKGPIPSGFYVLHKCDVRCCVNPDHLFLGTCQDNVDDMIRKGRQPQPARLHGEQHGNAKLTDDQVRKIRADPRSQQAIAKDYAIDQSAVSLVKRRKRWDHVQ